MDHQNLQVLNARQNIASDRSEAVNCNGCTACCHNELITLCTDEDPRKYKLARLLPPRAVAIIRTVSSIYSGWVFEPLPSGACPYLGETGCTIYEDRPRVCRTYSCTGWVKNVMANTTRPERRRMQKSGQMDMKIFNAGKSRLQEAERTQNGSQESSNPNP